MMLHPLKLAMLTALYESQPLRPFLLVRIGLLSGMRAGSGGVNKPMSKRTAPAAGYTAPKGQSTPKGSGADRSAVNRANRSVTMQWVIVVLVLAALVGGVVLLIEPQQGPQNGVPTAGVGGHG